MNLDRYLDWNRAQRNLNTADLPKADRPALDLTFQDAGGQTHTEPLARYDGASYRVEALLGAGITQQALIRLPDGRAATMPALAL